MTKMTNKLLFFVVALAALSLTVHAEIINEATGGATLDAGATVDLGTVSVDAYQDFLATPVESVSDAVTIPSLKVDLVASGGHPTRRFIELLVTNQGLVDKSASDLKDWGVLVKNANGELKDYAYEFQTVKTVSENAPYNAWTVGTQNYLEFNNQTGLNESKSLSVVNDDWKTASVLREIWTTVSPKEIVFPAGKSVRVRVWVSGVKWTEQVDIIPKILGVSLEKLAWANLSAYWRGTFNITRIGTANVTWPLVHLVFDNVTHINTSYCNSAANMSFYWADASGETALFGSSSVGAFVEQFNYASVQNLTHKFTSVWLRLNSLNDSYSGGTPALRIYCGTNGGTRQYDETVVFQDETSVELFEKDAGGVVYGYNQNSVNANATSSTVGTVLNRNYSVGSQAGYNCDGVNCIHKYFVQTPFTHNATANVKIYQVQLDAPPSVGDRLSHDEGAGGIYEYWSTTSKVSCETTDGVLRTFGNTTETAANGTPFTFACLYNKSMGGAGTQNGTAFMNGVEQQSVNMGDISFITGLVRFGTTAATNSHKGAYHSAIFIKGGNKWVLDGNWVKNVHDTRISSVTQETADTTAPTIGTGSCGTTNQSTLSSATYLTFNISASDNGAIDSMIFNVNGTNTTQTGAWNFSITSGATNFEIYAFVNDTFNNKVQSAAWSCYYPAPVAAGGGGGSQNPVRSTTPITIRNGQIISQPSTDYLATFRLWLRQETLFGDFVVPNWTLAFLILGVGAAIGTRKNPKTNKDELTGLGQASVALGILTAFAFFV